MLKYDSVESSQGDYKRHQEAIRQAIIKSKNQEPTEILKAKLVQLNAEEDPKRKKLCEMSRMLFHEGLEQFEGGKLTFEDFINDLHRSFLAIGKAIEGKDIEEKEEIKK